MRNRNPSKLDELLAKAMAARRTLSMLEHEVRRCYERGRSPTKDAVEAMGAARRSMLAAELEVREERERIRKVIEEATVRKVRRLRVQYLEREPVVARKPYTNGVVPKLEREVP